MIPKIIHYSWFSGEEMPEAFKFTMQTWRRVLPDYEFVLWDAEALKKANIMFANEAYSVRKWAFAADVIRSYALYHHGGIWLDCDVVMVQSFDQFLHCRAFTSKEYSEDFWFSGNRVYFNTFASHCIGAEKGHPYIKDCLDYYNGRHFILSDNTSLPQELRFDMKLLPSIQAILAFKYGYKGGILDVDKEEVLKEDIHVYPAYYFDRPRYHTIEEVYCIHNHVYSWKEGGEHSNECELLEKPKKKDLFYYMYTMVNKYLAKIGLQIRISSI